MIAALILSAVELASPPPPADSPGLVQVIGEMDWCYEAGRPIELLRVTGNPALNYEERSVMFLLGTLNPGDIERLRAEAMAAGVSSPEQFARFVMERDDFGQAIKKAHCEALEQLQADHDFARWQNPEIEAARIEAGCVPDDGKKHSSVELATELAMAPGELRQLCRLLVIGPGECDPAYRRLLSDLSSVVANNLSAVDGRAIEPFLLGRAMDDLVGRLGLAGQPHPSGAKVAVFRLGADGRYGAPKVVSPDELLDYIRGPACQPLEEYQAKK